MRIVVTLFLVFLTQLAAKEKIAVCIPASGASDASVQSLVESARRHFCRMHDVRYFIVGDGLSIEGDDIEWLPGKKFSALQDNKKILESYAYLFVIDPKMTFVAPVGDEVFGNLIAVQKTNSKTQNYSCRFFGGRPQAVLDLLRCTSKFTDSMSEDALINQCFKEKPPTRILSPSYAYPENWELQYARKIIESKG